MDATAHLLERLLLGALLPVWMLAYRYHDKPYRVFVNAGTGEVQGERPYSWVKILCAVLAGLAAAAAVAAIAAAQ